MIEVATVMLLVVVLFQSWLLREKVDREIEPASPVYAYRTWIGISVILLIQRAFFIILDETDIIMVGSLIGPAAAGIYNAAAKTAKWVSFVLEIMVMVAGPAFATLYAQGDMPGLQKVVSRVTIWIFLPSTIICVFLLAFTQPVLSIFGQDFIAATGSLKVLILGRLVNALCGTVACLMVMTGHQKKSLPVFCCSALINLGLNAIAIPRFGILGAAMTTSFTLVIWNIWLSILVVKHIRVRPSIFYSLLPKNWLTDG
ncbi:MAG: oligosaccharide flippase family protein [Symploca sp. SIO3E6]|nr:oligosaccharide flippase family protein [Caldora sp. SIO3E6]